MALQTKILRRTYSGDIPVKIKDPSTGEVTETTKKLTAGTGTLIGGTPGQIYDVAYGPVVHTTTLTAPADIGSFVEGQGIIVNSPEYALYGQDGKPLAPSLTLPKGAVVSCMTAGHVWIKYGELAAIQAGMNAAVIWQEKDATADDDLLVVEVNGMSSYGPGSDTSANG